MAEGYTDLQIELKIDSPSRDCQNSLPLAGIYGEVAGLLGKGLVFLTSEVISVPQLPRFFVIRRTQRSQRTYVRILFSCFPA